MKRAAVVTEAEQGVAMGAAVVEDKTEAEEETMEETRAATARKGVVG